MNVLSRLKQQADKLRWHGFDGVMVSHYDQIDDVLTALEEERCKLHPDSDDWELCDFLVGDVLQPMLNDLESRDEDCFDGETSKKVRESKKLAETWVLELLSKANETMGLSARGRERK